MAARTNSDVRAEDSTTDSAVGMAHLTVVPANFERGGGRRNDE